MLIVRDVRTALLATALLFAATLLAILSVALWLDRYDATQRAEATTRDMALILEEYAKRTLETSDNVLSDISEYVRDHKGAQALRGSGQARDYLVRLSRDSSSGDYFTIIDRDGSVVASTAQLPSQPISLQNQSWFREVASGVDHVVGQAVLDPISGEVLFTYTHRLVDAQGAFDGAAQVAIRPTFFQEVTHGGGKRRLVFLAEKSVSPCGTAKPRWLHELDSVRTPWE
jgi:two-component system, sensor histidine kinase PdtaS